MPNVISSIDRRWVSTVLRLAVGAVFMFSGLTKVLDVTGTTRAVRAYKLLPESLVNVVGPGLPVLELALAVLLIAGLMTRAAAVATALLCLAFFFGVAHAWAKGLSIQCGCFGNDGFTAHPVPGYVRELVLNALMITACGWLFRYPASRLSLDSALGLQVEPEDVTIGAR